MPAVRPALHRAPDRAVPVRSRPLRRGVAALAVIALGTGLAGSAVLVGAPTADAAPVAGTVSGTVFEDYNSNGTQDAGSNVASSASATDVGVAGATVAVTDSTGANVGNAVSAADGTFSVAVTAAATNDVRVEITPPTGFTAGPHGADSDSTVQFVVLGAPSATSVSVGLVRQGDYSQDAPALLNVQQVAAIGTSSNLIDQTNKPTLVRSAYSARGTTATTAEAYADQTGTIWGSAALHQKYAFTAAFLRRHARLGPGGLGQIYLTDLGTAPNASPWVTIPNVGSSPRTNESAYTVNQWFHDVDAYPAVGKVGLGGMALAPDGSALYVMNLTDKNLYKIPFTGGSTGAPVAGTPVSVGAPTSVPGCADSYVRPFGVSAQNGAIWTTETCTGPNQSDLKGYVYRYDTAAGTFTLAYQTDLSGYARGKTYNGSGCCAATWNTWSTSDTTFPGATTGSNKSESNPEPLLSDVNFDSNGDMTVSVKDRFSDQIGYEAGDVTPSSTTTYEGFAGGDILRACLVNSAWVQESAGVCGTRTGHSTTNNQGPGGGEFYTDEYGTTHQQIALGGVLQLPGYGDIISTDFDPINIRTSGVQFLSNTNGAVDGSHELVHQVNSDGSGAQGGFGKAGGLGDINALVADAPIEIGNRVWIDTNGDGLQTAGEASVPGVTVRLYAAGGTTPVATATTAADGTYYFSSATGTDTGSAKYGLDLQPGTTYDVRLDNPSDFTGSGPLTNYTPTTTAAGNDRAIDSNGAVSGGSDQASVTTGAAGTNNHTIDFGFLPPSFAVGDYVWYDTNHNGVQDVGETGVSGVTATLLDSSGQPATHPDGSPVAAVETDSAGHYSFDYLAAGSYTVQFSGLPTGYVATTQQAGAATSATDSNPDSTLLTPPFTLGPIVSGNDMRAVQSGDGVTKAYAINPTIDLGIVVRPSVTVGDYVFADNNGNGIQDRGDKGISGVTVTLTGPGGHAVTDIFGQPVTPVHTDSGGRYLFPNLPVLQPGQSYTAHVDNSQSALSGYVPTTAHAGSDTTKDSSTSSAASVDLTTGGAEDLSLDFGFVTPGAAGTDSGNDHNGGAGTDSDSAGTADTGVPVGQLVGYGLAVLLAGLGLLFVARRRRLNA